MVGRRCLVFSVAVAAYSRSSLARWARALVQSAAFGCEPNWQMDWWRSPESKPDEVGLPKRALGADIRCGRNLQMMHIYPVFADRMQLQCALMNLSVNAKAAMPNGGTLTSRTHNTAMSAMDVRRSGRSSR